MFGSSNWEVRDRWGYLDVRNLSENGDITNRIGTVMMISNLLGWVGYGKRTGARVKHGYGYDIAIRGNILCRYLDD